MFAHAQFACREGVEFVRNGRGDQEEVGRSRRQAAGRGAWVAPLAVTSRDSFLPSLVQLFELQIEGVQSGKIEGLSEKFQALASLSFVNCGLNTLDGLPKLPALTTVSC